MWSFALIQVGCNERAQTREQIRDESIREGLMPLGAVKTLSGIPTTSSKGRYFLEAEFADLFNPNRSREDFVAAVEQWQEAHLSPQALMRMTLVGLSRQTSDGQVSIRFPNGTTEIVSSGLVKSLQKLSWRTSRQDS